MKRYGLTVKRTLNHHFEIEARSGAEAAMKLGQLLAGDPGLLDEGGVEIDRRMMAPEVVDADQLDLTGDTVTASDEVDASVTRG
jgi:hypothetical protein